MPHLARRAERFRTADAATIFSSARPSTRQAKTPRRDSQGRQAKRAPLAKEACGPPRRKAACRRSLRQKARLRKREPSQRGNVNRRRVQGQPPPRHATKTRQRNAKECQGQGRSQESLQSLLQASPFSAPLKSQPFPVFSASTRPRFSMRSDALGHRPKRGCARAIARRFVQNACRQVRFRGRDRRFRVRYRHTSIREGCPRIEPRFACPHRTLRALRGRTIRRSHP